MILEILYSQGWTSTLRVSRTVIVTHFPNSADKVHEYIGACIRDVSNACEFFPTYDVIHTYDRIEPLHFH